MRWIIPQWYKTKRDGPNHGFEEGRSARQCAEPRPKHFHEAADTAAGHGRGHNRTVHQPGAVEGAFRGGQHVDPTTPPLEQLHCMGPLYPDLRHVFLPNVRHSQQVRLDSSQVKVSESSS